MARIAGVDVPDNKRVEVAIQRIHGIGPTLALKLLETAGVSDNPRVRDLAEADLGRIREVLDKEYRVEGDLRREVNLNIRRLMDIGSYRGIRHRRNLPVRGQRTHTNARTKKGPRRAIAGKKRVVSKKG